jgi:hypothetical protein
VYALRGTVRYGENFGPAGVLPLVTAQENETGHPLNTGTV